MATRKRPIELLTEEELQALIDTGSRRAPTGIRNRALIGLLYFAGLRIGATLELMPRDVDLVKGEINVRRGKGGKQRIVGFGGPGCEYLARWMDKRKGLGINGHHRLFCTLKGGPLSARYVAAMLERYAKRAGIEKRVFPHLLRHCHARALIERGLRVDEIRDQLGHSSIATTSQYLSEIAPAERVRRIHELDWSPTS